MIRIPKQEIKRLFYLVAFTSFLGWILGYPLIGLISGLIIYIGMLLHNLQKLHYWLKSSPSNEVPEASGLWDEVFAGIYQLQRGERRARASLLGIIERARASVSALEEAVVLIDGDGNLEWWNPAANKLLGLRSGSDKGQPVTNFIRDPAFINYFEAGQYEQGLQLPSAIHPSRYLQFELTRFGSNDHLMIVYDITRLHNLEQMRKDFVANVSHELRTPLTVVSGYLETLLDNADSLNPRIERALQQMQQQAGRMNSLVNDLLLLARLENDTVRQEKKPVDVAHMLEQLRLEGLAYGHDKNQTIHLAADTTLFLSGIEGDLRSAFSNLITNAVKYTPENRDIAIRWWSDESGAHLSVTDQGIGIEPRHIPRLTERFYRADSARSLATGGTGLGLAIVKHVLLQHHATLDITSTYGKGSTFTCHFPEQFIKH